MRLYAILTALVVVGLNSGCTTDPSVPHPVVDSVFPNSETALRDSTGSKTAQPVMNSADLQKLDLTPYNVATVVPFNVEPGKGIDPIHGTKFAGDVYGRLKHDFGDIFAEVRFGEPEGKTNELIVTGTIKFFSEGTGLGLLATGPSLIQSLPFGKANIDALLILQVGAKHQTFYTADINELWGVEEALLGAKGIDRKGREAAAAIANTIARGRGWQPSGQKQINKK